MSDTYKVVLKRCDDPERAARIAEAVAQWSGATAGVVASALQKKSICISKQASEEDARRLQQHFESVGAEVEMVVLGPARAASGVADLDDDEDDIPGRIRSDEELVEVLRDRDDIFRIERNTAVRNSEVISFIFGLILCVGMAFIEFPEVSPDFFEKLPEERTAKIVQEMPELKKEDESEKQKEIKSDKKKISKKKNRGRGGRRGGGGDPRARVTRKGVLGIISGRIKGKTVATADIFGKGGFATNLDAILQGVGGLKSGGSGGVGRKGVAGIGFGTGYGSGFGGGGSGGVDDLIGSLMEGDGAGLNLRKRGKLEISPPQIVQVGAMTGGRSAAEIMRVVQQNKAALRYAYNRRLREKPGLRGKIKVKFAIDEYGKVILCTIVESTMNDSKLEKEVVAKIRRWRFGKIDKPGDVTTVIHPFVFQQ